MASVQQVLNGLAKYLGSEDLTLIVHVNQATRFLPPELTVPPLRLAVPWVFAAISPDRSRRALWGDVFERVDSWQVGTFDYPEPALELGRD